MMCRRCTWNARKILGVVDLKGFRERLGEYVRRPSINGPSSTIRGVEPVKSRGESARSSSAQSREVKAGLSRTEAHEGDYLLPNVAQAQPETEGSFCADTKIAKDKQNICLALIILDVGSGGD